MTRVFLSIFLAASLIPLGASAADYSAGVLPVSSGTSFISEARMGVMAHDISMREQGTIDLQAEILFQPLDLASPNSSFAAQLLSPRPHIGGSVNTNADTSYGYAGLSWYFPVFGPVFIEASFGGSVHNGKLNNTDIKREPLGTRALFRETGSIGFDHDRFRLLLTVEHMSNAGLGTWNHGLTNVGARIGYVF